MARQLTILENSRIAAPCSMSWHAMKGDDRVRYCDACRLNVYNLIDMDSDAADALIREKEGDVCIRLYQRPDGTLITSNCPVGLRAARRRLTRAVSAIAACFAFMITAATFGAFGNAGATRLRLRQPFVRIVNWLTPTPVPVNRPQILMGRRGPAVLPASTNKKSVDSQCDSDV